MSDSPEEKKGFPVLRTAKPFDGPEPVSYGENGNGNGGGLEQTIPKNVPIQDPMYDYASRLEGGGTELWQKANLNFLEKRVYSRALLLDPALIKSPDIKAAIGESFAWWPEYIKNLGLLGRSENGWAADHLGAVLTARRYMPASGEAVHQQIEKKKRRFW